MLIRALARRAVLWLLLAVSAAGCGSLEIGIEYVPLQQVQTPVASKTPPSPPIAVPAASRTPTPYEPIATLTAPPTPTPYETDFDAPGLLPFGETASGAPILQLANLEGADSISWSDSQHLVLADNERGGSYSLPVSLGSSSEARFEPTVDMVHSPEGTLAVRCNAGLVLFRLSDNITLATSDLNIAGGCHASVPPAAPEIEAGALAYVSAPAALEWQPNGRNLAFVAEGGGLYLWPSDGSAARKVDVAPADLPLIAWSPVGTTLAFVRTYDPQTSRVSLSAISSVQGQLWEEEFELEGDPRTVSLAWIGYQAILVRSATSWSVLDAHTGKRLTYWTADSRLPWFQMPSASPDGRWLAIEVTGPSEATREYKLVDLKTLASVPLGKTAGNYLDFSGWKADSSLFYFVSYPANQFSVSDAITPFGLLAADPRTKSVFEVFGGSLAATLSPDRRWTLVTLPDRGGDGSLRMTVALWEIGSMATAWRRVISDEMVYADGRWVDGTRVGARPFAHAAWSHDGSRVVFEDHQGSLYFGGIEDAVEVAAAGLLTPWVERTSAEPVRFTWSPEDHFLLVETEGGAWILPSVP